MLSESPWVSFLGMAISVVIITCLAYLFTKYVVGMKQGMFQSAQKKESMRVINQMYLGKNQRLVIVKVMQKYMVLGVTENNVTMIREMEEQEIRPWIEEEDEKGLAGKTDFKKSLIEILKKEKTEVKDSGGKSD